MGEQTGIEVHDQEHDATRADEGYGTARAVADALLHTADAGAESVYSRREGEGCISGFQNGEGESDHFERRRTKLTGGKFMFRRHALAGALPGVKKASW